MTASILPLLQILQISIYYENGSLETFLFSIRKIEFLVRLGWERESRQSLPWRATKREENFQRRMHLLFKK